MSEMVKKKLANLTPEELSAIGKRARAGHTAATVKLRAVLKRARIAAAASAGREQNV